MSDDPDFHAWAEHQRLHVMPMMHDSALIISLVPKGEADIKFAVELGLAIMLDKPLIVVIAPGQIVAGKLRQVADSIIEWEPGMGNDALRSAIEGWAT
jgi:hypothetical protein